MKVHGLVTIGLDYGCKGGYPHDYETVEVLKNQRNVICILCGKKKKYHTDIKGRPEPTEYYNDNIRNFCQSWGEHSTLYHFLYGENNKK